MNKIESSILFFILTEAFFLLFSFNSNLFSIIIGIIIGTIFIFINHKIKKNNIIKILLFLVSIPLFIFSIYKTSLFIKFCLLTNYSTIIISLSLLIITIYLASKKYHTFITIIEILFYIILLFKIINFLLCIPLINLNNIHFSLTINYNFIYISLFILFIDCSLNYINNYKINKKEIPVSFSNLLIIKLLSLSILGSKLTNIYQYPFVNCLRRIKYFDFIERMEGILSFEYLLCFIIFISFLLFNIKALKKPI